MAQRGMTDYNVSLSAGVPQSLNVDGDYFHCKEAPNAGGVLVRFDESKQSTYKQGVGARVYYNRVELMSAASQDVVVSLGFGHVADARANVNANISTTIEGANLNTELPEVTVPAGDSVKIADANSDRKELRVSIKSDAPGGVYLGSATVADNTGGWIEPGMIDYIATEAELWAYNPGAADVIVSALDLERV